MPLYKNRFPTSSTYLQAATSAVKTPTSNTYLLMTTNSVTIEAGVWRITGYTSFANNASSPAYTATGVGIYRANGGDVGTAPTALSGGTITVNSAYQGALTFRTHASTDNEVANAPSVIVTATASTVIYCVPYVSASTAANARVTAFITAERLY